MLAMAVESTPVWATLVVGAIGGVGASLIIGGLNLVNARTERRHALDLKKLERQHDLELRQLEDQQRLRDDRLRLLRRGLEEAVDGLLDLAKLAYLTLFGDEETSEKKAVMASALDHYERGRARLVLDPAGDKIARQFSAIEREIDHYRSMIYNQAGLLQAQAPSAVTHGEAIENQKKKIDGMIYDAITTSQQIMTELAKPITPGSNQAGSANP